MDSLHTAAWHITMNHPLHAVTKEPGNEPVPVGLIFVVVVVFSTYVRVQENASTSHFSHCGTILILIILIMIIPYLFACILSPLLC